jgi:hypothetical protein
MGLQTVPTTRKLMLFTITLYGLLPLPWILWRPETFFYHFRVELLPQIALAALVFFLAWCGGEWLRPGGGWFAKSECDVLTRRWPVGLGAIVASLLCSAVANTVLASMGALTIDETMGRERIPILTALGNAHLFALIYSACLLLHQSDEKPSPVVALLAVASVAGTLVLGLIEGRRTAVILPLVVYAVIVVISGRKRVLKPLMFAVPAFAVLVLVATYNRAIVNADMDDGDLPLLVGDAVVGRLGNPLLMLDPVLEHRATESVPFNPRTWQSIAATLPTLGAVPAPFENGFGNEFGHQMGLLALYNELTGINSGWLGELLLYGGIPALVVGGLALGSLAASCWNLISLTNPAGVFLRVMVFIFIVSGFQMEVAYPIGSLLRALVIALVIATAEAAMAQKRTRHCTARDYPARYSRWGHSAAKRS